MLMCCVCFDETNTLWSLSGIRRMWEKSIGASGGEEFTSSRVNELPEPPDSQSHRRMRDKRCTWSLYHFSAAYAKLFFCFNDMQAQKKNAQEHGSVNLNSSWRSHIAGWMSIKEETLQDKQQQLSVDSGLILDVQKLWLVYLKRSKRQLCFAALKCLSVLLRLKTDKVSPTELRWVKSVD